MKTLQLVPALLLTFAAPAFSMPVTFTSQWLIGTLTNENDWEPITNEAFLTFTYEDSTPDSNPSSEYGFYRNSVLAATFSYGDKIYSLSTAAPNSIDIYASAGPYTWQGVVHGMSGVMIDNRGQFFDFDFYVEGYMPENHPTTDALKDLPNWIGVPGRDTHGLFLTQHGLPAGSPRTIGYAWGDFVRVDSPVSVPEPVSAGLAGLGIAAIAFARRRRQAA